MSYRYFFSHLDMVEVANAHRKAAKDVTFWGMELNRLNDLLEELGKSQFTDCFQHSQVINTVTRYTVERNDAALSHTRALHFRQQCEDLLLRETPHISQIIKENSLWQE